MITMADLRPPPLTPAEWPARPPAPAPVLVAVDGPAPQRRLTVALRPILAVPHLLALVAIGLLALPVAVAGWTAALVTGRLPRGVADVLSGVLRFQTRLVAYLFLLTDVYPPFSLRDDAYPVRLTSQVGRLHRGAVAFRLLLALPAVVVAATVTYGASSGALVVTWFVVLVTGRVPPSLHQVFAAFVRYQARLLGYLTLVTAQYPWGLLGDLEVPIPDDATTVVGSAPVIQLPPPSPVDEKYWRVTLSSRAKNLVVLFLVLTVAVVATANVSHTVSRVHQLDTDEAASTRVQGAYGSLSQVVADYHAEVASCRYLPQPLPCLTGAAQSVSAAFTVFVDRLTTSPMPGPATSAQALLASDAVHVERAFAQMSASTTAARYQTALGSASLPGLLQRFDRDYQALGAELNALG